MHVFWEKAKVPPPPLTVWHRLGPAGVRGRIVIHQVQVDPGDHGIQLGGLLTVGGEELVGDSLSSHQVVPEPRTQMQAAQNDTNQRN